MTKRKDLGSLLEESQLAIPEAEQMHRSAATFDTVESWSLTAMSLVHEKRSRLGILFSVLQKLILVYSSSRAFNAMISSLTLAH